MFAFACCHVLVNPRTLQASFACLVGLACKLMMVCMALQPEDVGIRKEVASGPTVARPYPLVPTAVQQEAVSGLITVQPVAVSGLHPLTYTSGPPDGLAIPSSMQLTLCGLTQPCPPPVASVAQGAALPVAAAAQGAAPADQQERSLTQSPILAGPPNND